MEDSFSFSSPSERENLPGESVWSFSESLITQDFSGSTAKGSYI